MRITVFVTTFLGATALAISSFGQSPRPPGGKVSNSVTVPVPANAGSAPAGQPSAADMQKMMQQMLEISKLNENHKLLTSLDGTWDYKIKFWMNPDPNAKPDESTGTATRKSIMGGRYVTMDVSGKMQMPGADGKMKDVMFKGMGIEGYDNVKQK